MSTPQPLADFHALTPDVIISTVEKALDLYCTNLCRPLNSYINRVYELEREDGDALIVKFYRPGRWSRAALEDEHGFLLELASREIPVIAPMVLANGQTLGEQQGIFFTVFPKKSGRSSDEFTDDQWEEIGRLIGRVHAVGVTRPAGDRATLTPDKVTRDHIEYLVKGDFIPEGLASQYQEITGRLLKLTTPMFAHTESVLIHGDCHFSNIIHRPGESFYLIDFDDMVLGPPIQDLWMLLPGYANDCLAEIEIFMEGYEVFHPFDQKSLSIIEPLRAMRYIHYSAWCARQSADGGLSRLAPGWGTPEYWQQEIRDLQEQILRIEKQ